MSTGEHFAARVHRRRLNHLVSNRRPGRVHAPPVLPEFQRHPSENPDIVPAQVRSIVDIALDNRDKILLGLMVIAAFTTIHTGLTSKNYILMIGEALTTMTLAFGYLYACATQPSWHRSDE